MTQPHEAAPTCPRHPQRVSYVRCQRCGRPVCGDCQQQAAVGIQCVDCVREASAADRPTLTVGGGRASRSDTPVLTIAIMVICGLVFVGELVSPRVYGEGALAPFIAAARSVSARSTASAPRRGSSGGGGRAPQRRSGQRDYGPIREWASANGYTVSERGRVPASVLEAYDAAH